MTTSDDHQLWVRGKNKVTMNIDLLPWLQNVSNIAWKNPEKKQTNVNSSIVHLQPFNPYHMLMSCQK